MKTNFDHLAIRDPSHKSYKKISEIVKKEEFSEFSKMVFSDYVYKYDTYMEKTKVILLITDISIFILNPKDFSKINYSRLIDLDTILPVKTNSSIIAMDFKKPKEADKTVGNADWKSLLLESIRRTELLLFLLNCATNNARKKPIINYTRTLNLVSKSHQQTIKFQKENEFGFQANVESRDFILARKYGYLFKNSKTWYKAYTEKFFVLTNIGLIYMENPTDQDMRCFPSIDFEWVQDEKDLKFTLKTAKGKQYDLELKAQSK